MLHLRQSGPYFIEPPELDVCVTHLSLSSARFIRFKSNRSVPRVLEKQCQSDRRKKNQITIIKTVEHFLLLTEIFVTKTNKMIIETGVGHCKAIIYFFN